MYKVVRKEEKIKIIVKIMVGILFTISFLSAYPIFLFASQGTNTWWTAAEGIPQPSINVSAGGSLTYYSYGGNRFLYAFFGGGTRNFQRINLNNIYSQIWEGRCQAPDTVTGVGAHLATSENKIRAVRGNGAGSYEFWEYDEPNDKWYNAPYEASPTAGAGKCIINVNATDYYALKGSGTGFIRYRISADWCTTNEWQTLAAAPWAVAVGAALAYNGGDYIFALRGDGAGTDREFARYTISTNTWSDAAAADLPPGVTAGAGAALAYVPSGVGECTDAGGCIYALRGRATDRFYRYDINANTWTARAAAPWNVGAGGALVYTGGNYLYAFGGANTVGFARYDITTNTWSDLAVADPPAAVSGGGSLTYLGGAYSDYIYARPTSGNTTFWRYSISGNTWSTLSSFPYTGGTSAGNILAGNASTSSIYAFAGSGTLYPDFWRYDIPNNRWGPYALNAPTGAGCALVKYDDDDVYLVFGNSSTRFERYRSSTNAWTALTALPAAATTGSNATYAHDGTFPYIYYLRGNGTTGFDRWQIPDGTAWTAMAPTPAGVGAGSALTWTGGDYIYAFRGGTTTAFWRYCISANSWNCGGFTPAVAPANVGAGGSLAWTGDDYIYAFGGGTTTAFWRYRWRDSIKPSKITDLSAQRNCSNPLQIDLSWTTPGDDYNEDTVAGSSSICTSYEIRYNTVEITDANWASSSVATTLSCSGTVGAAQSVTVSVPNENTTYYFAIKSRDEGHPWDANLYNWSDISNVPSIKTPTAGQGTASISPTEVAAGTGGNTMTITYTAGTDSMVCGRLYIDIPSGWSPPSTDPLAHGYTTTTAGTITNIVGQQIQITDINIAAGGQVTIVYGSKAGGGPGADAQTTVGSATFTISSHSGPGTPAAIEVSPTVNVVAGTGEGSATISPSAVIASSSGNNIQIVYTPGVHNMNKGRVYVDVPSGWTEPTTTGCPGAAGCVSVTGGGSPIVNTSGQQIQISNIILSSPSTLTINYNNAMAQSTITCSQVFTVSSAAGDVPPGAITLSPTINVAGTGEGTASATPYAIVVSSTGNTINFTYTAGGNNLCNGRVYIDIPAAFPDAPSTTPTANGYSTTTNGTLTVSGQQIQVTGINLTANSSMTITYGSKTGGGAGFTAPSSTGNWTFTTYSATGPVTPTAIASSPVVIVTTVGEGTASITPPEVGAGTSGNTMTITYNAGATAISDGRVYVDVPPGWTQPDSGNTSTSQGSLNFSGMQIQVTGVNCSSDQTSCVVITYGTPSGITAQSNPAYDLQFTVYSAAGPVDPRPIATSPTVDVLPTGEGTASISPEAVIASSTGNTLTITYTAGSTALSNGRVYVDIPAGWSPPSTTPTAPGYTTSSHGVVSVSGQQIRVTGINLSASASMTITYGSIAEGGPGATAEANIICGRQFPVYSAVGNVTPMPIATYPTVNLSVTGQGTASISPSEVGQSSPGNTITITYTAGVNDLCNGRVYIDVPSGWSAPSTTPTAPGYTTSSVGVVSVSGQQIRVTGINLSANSSITITYGSTSGGGPGATASSTIGPNTFTVSAATGGVPPANIGISPSVNVLATGKGSATISPTCVQVSSAGNNITITYTPAEGYPLTNGRVYVAVPSGWSTPLPPTDPACPSGAGCTSSSAGTITISGMEIRVSGVTISSPSTLTINYNNATAQSTANTSVEWITKDAVGNVTPMPISLSPTMNVATAGVGTNTVSPNNVIVSSTGNTLIFTYTASEVGMKAGIVYISVPCAATPTATQFAPCPQTVTPSGAGYLTCTAGSCSWNDSLGRIEVTGLNLSASQSFNILYGDKSSGGSGVSAPTATGDFTFLTKSSTGACVTPTDISTSPVVQVLPEGGSGTSASATGYSSQRKVVRNSYGFWMFYDNGTNFVNRFSSTGLVWSGAEQTVFTTTTRVGSIWVDTTNNKIYAIGWPTAATTKAAVRKGDISAAGNPVWETQVSPTMSGINNDASALCSICRASDEYIWIACEQLASTNNRNVSVSRSTAANSVSNFAAYVTASTNNATRNFAPIVLPASATGQVYLIYNRAGNIEGRVVNTDLTLLPVESIAAGISADWARSIAAINDASYNIHAVYIASDGSLRYRYRQAGAWQPEVTLDSATTCYSPSIQLRGTDLYVTYNKGNDIYIVKGVSPYAAAGNWTTPSILKTDTITTTHYAVTNAIDMPGVTLIHTAGTASPYSVRMEIIGQGTATLTTPATGELGAGTSGNTIVFSYTAGQSGMTNGKLYIDFPAGWTVSAPSTSGGGSPIVTQVGLQTQITNISLSAGATMTITYSNVTTQSTVENNVKIKFSSSAKDTITNPVEIQTHPTINIKPSTSITLDDNAISIANSSADDVLRVVIQNPSSAVTIIVNNFKFQFKDYAGNNLTTAEAQSLFSAMRVFLDNGDNNYGTGDTQVGEVLSESFNLSSGVQQINGDGSVNCQVGPSSSKTYLLVLTMQATATDATKNAFKVFSDADTSPTNFDITDLSGNLAILSATPSAGLTTRTMKAAYWRASIGSNIYTTPVFTTAGGYYSARWYVGADNGYLYAIRLSDGETIWSYSVGSAIRSSVGYPYYDGNAVRVFFGADDGSLYCVLDNDATASPGWSAVLHPGQPIRAQPAVRRFDPGGVADQIRVHIGCRNGASSHVHAFNAATGAPCDTSGNCSTDWLPLATIGGNISDTVATINFVFAAAENGELYKLNTSDGTVQASTLIGTGIIDEIYIESNAVYCASGNTVYRRAFSNLADVWSYPAAAAIEGGISSMFRPEVYLYVPTTQGKVIALNKSDGTVAWEYPPGAATIGAVRSTPYYHTGTGSVFFYSDDGYVYAVNYATGTLKANFPAYIGQPPTAPQTTNRSEVLYYGGRIYVASPAGYVFAFPSQ